MEQDDTWEMLDEPSAATPLPRAGRRLTRRQKLLRAGGAALAVLVALIVIASQFGYLDFTHDIWNSLRAARAPTLTHTTLAPRPMSRIETGPWAQIPLPVSRNLFVDMAVASTHPATAYICTAAAPMDEQEVRPLGGLLFWRTQDAGQHWFTLPLIGALGYSCNLSVAPDDPNTVIALAHREPTCTMSAVYLTHDGGAHWHQAGQLPGVPRDLHFCSLWIAGSAHHLFLWQFYERNDLKQDDPQRYGTATYLSEDDGQTWRAAKRISEGMGYPVFLADGTMLLAAYTRADSPTAGDTVLWTSHDAGETWDPRSILSGGYSGNRILTAPGARDLAPSLASPVYLLANTTFSLGLRVQIAQITDDRHWATLPPLPIAGATAQHTGVTQALTVTPSGKLLALGLGPQDRIPADGQYEASLFARQWLWEWDPRLTKWSVITQPLDVPWPQCSDGCWSAYVTRAGADEDVWLRGWDFQGNPPFYRIRLPD